MTESASTDNDVSGLVIGTVIQAGSVIVGSERRPRRNVWMVPEPNRNLVERVDLADRLADLVSSGVPDIGVVGPGGFGKTTLVAQVCHRLRSAFPGGVLWVTLGEHLPDGVLADKINDLCEVIDGARPSLTDPAMAGHQLGELLSERGPTLLVIDDLWAASRLSAFPRGGTLTRVVTSRARGALPVDAEILRVMRMSTEESRSVLVTGLPRLTRTERLTRLTGGWPVLLSLVNGAIRRLAKDDDVAPDLASEHIANQLEVDGPDSLDIESADQRARAVHATVEASLRRLGAEGRDRFLELGVFPEDTSIPADVIGLLWSASGVEPAEARRLCRRLADLSLIDLADENLRLHDVLRTYLRHALGAERLVEINRVLVKLLTVPAQSDWRSAHPYALRHLASHAAQAGALDPLVTDAGFLLHAAQPELLACLEAARSEEARAAALIYQRAAHHLRDQRPADRPAYLAFAARRAGLLALADSADCHGGEAAWRSSWTNWYAQPDHKILTRHRDQVDEVALAVFPDGRAWAISRDISGEVHIVDIHSNESVEPPWRQHVRRLSTIACVPTPDGRVLAVIGTWDDIQAWDLTSGQRTQWHIPAGATGVHEISWTRWGDHSIVVAGHVDRTIRAWDAKSGALIGKPVSVDRTPGHSFWCIAAGTTPDGKLAVAVADEYAPVRLWNLVTGRRLGAEFAGRPLRTMKLTWGDQALFTSAENAAVQQWNTLTGQPNGPDLAGHARFSRTLLYTRLPAIGEALIIGENDGTLRVLNTSSGEALGGPVSAHAYSVRALACSQLPDGRTVVVTGGNENTVRLWDLQALTGTRRAPRMQEQRDEDPVSSMSLPDGRLIEVRGSGTVVEARDRNSGHSLWRQRTRVRTKWESRRRRHWYVTAVASTTLPDGRPIALSATNDGTIHMLDLLTGVRIGRTMNARARRQPSPAAVSSLSCTRLPDGRVIAVVGSEDTTQTTVAVWDLTSCQILARSNVRTAWVTSTVCMTLPGDVPVAVTGDTVLRVWPLTDLGQNTDWRPTLEIDLDAPIMSLQAEEEGVLIATTRYGMVRLHLQQHAGTSLAM